MSTSALSTSRRWPLWGLAVLALAAAGGGAWWYFRPGAVPPVPPAVDLSKADPEVVRVVNAALDDVRTKPRDAGAWGRLGMILRAHDFDTDSMSALATAAQLDPTDYRWPYLEGLTRVLFEPGAGLERLRKAAELAPADRPHPRLRVAEVLLERGDLDGATKLAESVPNNTRAALVLARVAAARGDWQAVLDRTLACANDSDARRDAALLRGQAFAARGENERSAAEFRAADELPPGRTWPDPVVREVEQLRVGTAARLARAAALLDQGNTGAAVLQLEEAVALAPNDPRAPLLLGQALIRNRNAPAARRVLEDFTTRYPDAVEGWFHLGVARFLGDDFAKAADAFRTVVKLKPDHALAHFNLGHCHRKLGDKPAAKTAFEEALRCRPDHQPARDALAELAAGK